MPQAQPEPTAEEGREERPWRRIEDLAEVEAWPEVCAYIDTLEEADWVHAAAHLPAEVLAEVLEHVDSETAAACLERLPTTQAAEAIEEIDPHAAATILEELPSDERIDLLAQLGDEELEAILSEVAAETDREARELLAYPADSAGGLMRTEFFSVAERATIQEVTDELRAHPEFTDYQIQYVYVADDEGRLAGVLPLRALLLGARESSAAEVMIPDPLRVGATATAGELDDLFEEYSFLGMPVVDDKGVLLGIVHRASVEEATTEAAQAETMKALGIASGEELRSMPLHLRAGRRLSWLSVNIGLNVLAASIIAAHQDTLQAVIALAVFLPMISDMSGCSGNQAVAVSLRELSLGVLRPNELLRVLGKEAAVGVINGVVLGLLIGVVAAVWQGNAALGWVVGGALAINTVVAVSIGGALPLVIRRLGQDPALASGPVLTTVTDMCGFFFALTFAGVALDRLVA